MTGRTSWTADDLLVEVFPPIRWAVLNIIAEGLTLLIGPPKKGKSWFVLGLLIAIATGGRALGSIPVEHGDCLYLALEDNPRRLQSRLRTVLRGAAGPERLTVVTECEPMPEGGERIRRWLDSHPDARLVVVDVLARVRARTNVRADRYDADYAAVAELKQIADDYGVAVLVIHHSRKADAEDYVDTISGTQGLAGAADAIVVLSRSRGASDAVLKVTGRDVPEAEMALNFDPTAGRWTLLDGPASDYEVSSQRRAILTAVRAEPGIGPKAIAERSAVAYDTVRQLVRAMVNAGTLDTDGAGHYFEPAPVSPPHNVHSIHTPSLSLVNGVNEVRREQ